MDVEKKRSQTRKHRVLMYHFDEACHSVLQDGERVTVEELQRRLRERYGVKCRPETIANMARQLAAEHGIGPVRAYYELNPQYFDRIGCHRPGTPRAWKKYMQGEKELDDQAPLA